MKNSTSPVHLQLQPAHDEERAFGPTLDFLRLLWSIDHGLHAASKTMEERYSVSSAQRLVLRVVADEPGATAGRVAEVLKVRPSTLTGILQRLQERGLLVRKRDPKDARRARFHLTARGRRLAEPRTGLVDAALQQALAGHPEKVGPSSELLSAVAAELDRAAGGR